MKKLFITTIALAAILSLGACGDKSEHKHKSRNRDNKESILFSSKSNKEEKEESESDEKEAHKSKISDITSNCVNIDPFETYSVSINGEKSAFPEHIYIERSNGEKDYWEYIDYDAQIISANKDEIVIEVEADASDVDLEDLSDGMFSGKEVKLEKEKKEYAISLDDIPICLLNSSMLTDDDLHELDNICREKVNEGLQCVKSENQDDYDYEIVSTYVSFGNMEDYISSEPVKLPYQVYGDADVKLTGNNQDVEHNNRVVFIYKSKSNLYYIGTVRPFFLKGELIKTECSDASNFLGKAQICKRLYMEYNSEEEAIDAMKYWLTGYTGYHEENFVKIANPTK